MKALAGLSLVLYESVDTTQHGNVHYKFWIYPMSSTLCAIGKGWRRITRSHTNNTSRLDKGLLISRKSGKHSYQGLVHAKTLCKAFPDNGRNFQSHQSRLG